MDIKTKNFTLLFLIRKATLMLRSMVCNCTKSQFCANSTPSFRLITWDTQKYSFQPICTVFDFANCVITWWGLTSPIYHIFSNFQDLFNFFTMREKFHKSNTIILGQNLVPDFWHYSLIGIIWVKIVKISGFWKKKYAISTIIHKKAGPEIVTKYAILTRILSDYNTIFII